MDVRRVRPGRGTTGKLRSLARPVILLGLLALVLLLPGCGSGGSGTQDGGDAGCIPESNGSLCARHAKDCDAFSAEDNCGQTRSVDCGSCPPLQTCGAGIPNVCGVIAQQDDEETILYNGEDVPFATATVWDGNASTLVDSTAAPHSGTNHLRATINQSNYWGAVAYMPAAALGADFATAGRLSFQAKADQPVTLFVGLADQADGQSDPFGSVELTSQYAEYVIPLGDLAAGVSLAGIYAVIFNLRGAQTQTYTVDIDDLKLVGGEQPSPKVLVTADDENIQLVGRWNTSDPLSPRSGWNSTYIVTAFTGSSLGICLDDGNNNWTYSIDGADHQTLVTSGTTTYRLAQGLADTTHTAVIARRTEPYFGQVAFLGFEVDQGHDLVAPPALPSRRIAFIGDSITAGFANEGSEQSRSTQNGYLAYGPQTARALDAQWHVTAISGIGMYRSLGDDSEPPADPVMADHYDLLLPYDPSMNWDHESWVPDALVLALGTNDFSYADLDREAFKSTYSTFLTMLRGTHPEAHIFCLSHLHPSVTDMRQDIEELVTAFGDARVYHLDPIGDIPGADNVTAGQWLDIGSDDGIGDWTHPSVAGNTKMAEKLAVEIQTRLGW